MRVEIASTMRLVKIGPRTAGRRGGMRVGEGVGKTGVGVDGGGNKTW